MPENPDADLTLPSVVADLPGTCPRQELVLTMVFHPDTSRIGETVVLEPRADKASLILGRLSPAFSRGQDFPGRALGEPHVSRAALALARTGPGLTIQRLPAASRCRVDGRELEGSIELDPQQLHKGVPVLLGHAVVLLLRMAPRGRDDVRESAAADMLRGSSACMTELKTQIERAAASDLDVLIRGETGTGKELVAEAIHKAGPRCAAPLVSVNMAAIPASLAAATLFGSARGAYTGASSANDGYFMQAEGGCLFLDEIGDTPAEVQPQLLRALQQRQIQSVGGPIRRANVRILSASDAALEGQGCDFKAALRHRLGACEIVLPPLREHPEDIGELLLHFLQDACEAGGLVAALPTEKSCPREIARWAELFHGFLCYSWPGNVRELANFSRQVVLASPARLTLPDHISKALREDPERRVSTPVRGERQARRKIRDIDEEEFTSALELNNYEVANTARQLRVSRQSVYRRMADSGRHRLAGQVPQHELEEVLFAFSGDTAATAGHLKVSPSGLRARLRDSALSWF